MVTWKPDHHVLEKKKSDQSDSVLEARALFLSSILDLQPHVAEDLWGKAFFKFSYAVAERFKSNLLGDKAHRANSGREVLAHLLLDAMHKLEADELSMLNDEKALGFTFGGFRAIDSNQLKDAFPDLASLMNSKETVEVSESIKQWSTHWNLDTDWCRDHALRVLREWLADETLKWAFLSPTMRSQLQRKGWRRAVTATIWYVQWSRVRDALIVFDGNLDPLKFRWRGSIFEAPGWNYLKDKEADWRRRTKVRFKVWVSQREVEIIGPLGEDAALDELSAAEIERQLAWRNGALTKFNNSLRGYLQRLKPLRKAAKSSHDLVEVGESPKLLQHTEWAVKYQICGQSLRQIGTTVRTDTGGVEPSTVSRAVEEVLSLIRLQKRADSKPGRSPGSKNKKKPILRDLGR